MKILLTPTEFEYDCCVGTGKDFPSAVLDFISQMTFTYGIESLDNAPLYEGLAKLAQGDTEFNHYDFSCPEDQFNLKIIP